MATFTIDTNAGPIVTLQRRTPAEVRSYMESSIPLLAKRGYTHRWTRRNGWFVIDIYNSRERLVHSAAFKRGTLR